MIKVTRKLNVLFPGGYFNLLNTKALAAGVPGGYFNLLNTKVFVDFLSYAFLRNLVAWVHPVQLFPCVRRFIENKLLHMFSIVLM